MIDLAYVRKEQGAEHVGVIILCMSARGENFVSRAGQKLQAALEAFCLDVRGLCCADFGCNIGGFSDCLLRNGAAKVYAVDTGYGQLAWKLRTDDRIVVMERTNALHCEPPEAVDLAAIDVAWTPQEMIIPAAMRWLKPCGLAISLLKPHYELSKMTGRKPSGALSDAQADQICLEVCRKLGDRGCQVRAVTRSILRGKGGNREFLLLLAATPCHW
jgi:23S rRNA (cytidine1920-2'-O)/16S rRNA (cytidine1409-2'-O)-methyltransferase